LIADRFNEIPGIVEAVQGEDPGFYRMELMNPVTFNAPSHFLYRGVTVYASTSYARLNRLLVQLGMQVYAKDVSVLYSPNTPVMNALLSVKYLIDNGFPAVPAVYEPVGGRIPGRVYENPYWLPVGFMVKPDILNVETTVQYEDPFAVQNNVIAAATGLSQPVLKQLRVLSKETENMRLTGRNLDIGYYQYDALDVSRPSGITIEFDNPEDQWVYAYLTATRATEGVFTGAGGNGVRYAAGAMPKISPLGYFKQGPIRFQIQADPGTYGVMRCFVYGLDQAAFDRAYEALRDEGLEVASFKDGRLEGTITTREDGVMFTSIPFDKGLKVEIDGQKAEILPVRGALAAVPLKAGTHRVEFRYRPEGLVLGWSVTLLSVVAFLCRWRKRGTPADYVETEA
jgi:uncharacterized membrane protein YfhO